jgi:hypothetical protein
LAGALAGGFAGCDCGNPIVVLAGSDGGTADAAAPGGPCGDGDPGCQIRRFGAGADGGLPLSTDPRPDPRESDQGLAHDPDGSLVLSSVHAESNSLWLANTDDWGVGSVSRVSAHEVKEVARYFTVTCWSNPGGGHGACDGATGCCARDDFDAFERRQAGQGSGPRQAVQLAGNAPSRTAVDTDGDVWVANRAFGGQSSVTKIASEPARCVERNGAAGTQTSRDVNGDGVIDTDCNRDGVPDDLAGVRARPCLNGKPQEFYGLDDECVLFTTNVNARDKWGRPLALGQSSVDAGPSDAWAGTYQDGRFFRIDGATGLTREEAKVPRAPAPYGAAVDAQGIVWVTNLGGGLQYFDGAHPQSAAEVRAPTGFLVSGYGIAIDRDQNVWTGGWMSGNAHRYTPDRSGGGEKLGQGWWTLVTDPGASSGARGSGRGIAADARAPDRWFVWMARDRGWVSRIDGSAIPQPHGGDQVVDGTGMPAVRVAGSTTIGAGVDADQNVWGVSLSGSVATRIRVDPSGQMSPPDLSGGADGQGCPSGKGDRCSLLLTGVPTQPDPYTYSDFTGFGHRNFTAPRGRWTWLQKGCDGAQTEWRRIAWDADLPAGTSVSARARSGPTPVPDGSWGGWTKLFTMSPADLKILAPNPARYLQLELQLATQNGASPRVKSIEISWECVIPPG